MVVTKVRVVWHDSNPRGTVEAKQIHIPAPDPLWDQDLLGAHKTYGENIARWAEESIGTSIGNGECWTLIHQALLDMSDTHHKLGRESPMISQGCNYGFCFFSLRASSLGSNSGLPQIAGVRR